MRLGSLTLSVTLSAALLSGCSFITGQPSQYKNPFAAQQAGHSGQYGQAAAGQNCQIATPRQPIPRGCRPEQVTIGLGQNIGSNGFPQQPQFGQPQYTNGGYGSAVGQTQAVAHHTPRSQKRKPKLRGSLSFGVEKSIDGDLIAPDIRGIIGTSSGQYNPQSFNQGFSEGTQADGLVTTTTYTANNLEAGDLLSGTPTIAADPNAIYRNFVVDRENLSSISLTNAWSTPLHIKGGLEYIVNDKFTTFANVGYTYAEGESSRAASFDATLYRETSAQPYDPVTLLAAGDPLVNVTFIPTQEIASFDYEISALEQLDLEVGGRYYFNPVVKDQGFRTVTPFVGASVGASRVNAVDVNVSQTQLSYQQAFEGGEGSTTFEVPNAADATRLYDAQWLPQAQLNVGAEWQITSGFALAAETGLKVQASREYSDFINPDGDLVADLNGDPNFSIPLTLRGSINF